MYITAFPHRDELFDITNRWLSNTLEPDDPIRITRIINYDSFTAWETMLRFISNLNRHISPGKIFKKSVTVKKELKDFICNATGTASDRIRRLVQEYRAMPEYYYVGSPVAGFIFYDADNRIVSTCRLKRAKRIAEKTSRYASMHITRKIRETAESLWRDSGGNPVAGALPNDILVQAEKRLMTTIRERGFTLPKEIMAIKDVMGIKIIRNGVTEETLESIIDGLPDVDIIEKETHSGNYNAVHYILELTVNRQRVVKSFRGLKNRTLLNNRGLRNANIVEDFTTFAQSGADKVQLDLILTTFGELIESEIGRSMHEARIFTQRQHQNSFGNIPINIEYLIEYLIAVGLSPVVHVDEIPIKLWGRYLPDTLSYRIRSLYDMPGYSIVPA
jgi:hypothetical protein